MTTAHATNRIDRIFSELASSGRRALMPFIVGGHPTKDSLPALLEALDSAGASVIEIGFPFSDPVADGPVIAEAMHTALQQGVTPDSVLSAVSSCRPRINAGLVAMVSASLVHRMGGPDAFARKASHSGFDGCIFPDVPVEESDPYAEACQSHRLTLSLLVAPTTPLPRAERIVRRCTGFVYVLARSGITGESGGPPDIAARIAQLRTLTDLPLAVGFGISTPEQVRAVTRHADAAIVGSALVRRLTQATAAGESPIEAARSMVFTLAQGLGSA